MFRAPGSRGQSSAVGSERYLPEGDINEERVSLGAIPIVMSLGKAVYGSSAFPDPATRPLLHCHWLLQFQWRISIRNSLFRPSLSVVVRPAYRQ